MKHGSSDITTEEKSPGVDNTTSEIQFEKPKEVNQMSIIERLGQVTSLLPEFTAKTGIPINQELIPLGHPNRPGTKLSKFQAIVIHYTANENPGATDQANAKYFRRSAEKGPVWDSSKKCIITDWIEAQTIKEQKVSDGSMRTIGTPFRYGSTQILFDDNSGSITIPFDEVGWGAGDRAMPYDNIWLGQQKLAKNIFNNSQNYRTLNIELCNNDIIKNSTADWDQTVSNSNKFVNWIIKTLGVTVNIQGSLDPQNFTGPLLDEQILLVRHHDITGKMCPKPFIDNKEAWEQYVRTAAAC